MQRRQWMKATAAAALAAASPPLASQPVVPTLVLIELNGGNDGLNTLVPYANPTYARLRPRLRIARDAVVPLDERVGMHPSLAALMQAWRSGELAWVQGIGYTPPNRSHFRSIEIWDSARSREVSAAGGWVAETFAEPGFIRPRALDAVVLGRPYFGPVAAAHMRAIYMRNPKSFLSRASRLAALEQSTTNEALAHVLRVRRALSASSAVVRDVLARVPQAQTDGRKGQLGKQLGIVARMIKGGAGVGVFKLSHSGYDTHAGQAGRHRSLLTDLAEALRVFREEMRAAGHWQNVVVATYSEFGRRVTENSSGGCDHGTAAPHLLLGGRIRGGLFGQYPSLDDLDGGDLRPTTRLTDYYATIATHTWGRIPALLANARSVI